MEVWEKQKCIGNTSYERMFPEPFKLIRNFHKWFFCIERSENIDVFLTLAISHLYVLLTALTELEELNVDRTVITDEGCTVLPSKLLFHHF